MDVQAFLKAQESYQHWQAAHPDASDSEVGQVEQLVNSQEFQNWILANPSGSVEDYLAGQRQQQEYANSPLYQLEAAEDRIQFLESRITELADENEAKDNEIADLQSSCGMLQVSLCASVIVAVVLAVICFRLHRSKKKTV